MKREEGGKEIGRGRGERDGAREGEGERDFDIRMYGESSSCLDRDISFSCLCSRTRKHEKTETFFRN